MILFYSEASYMSWEDIKYFRKTYHQPGRKMTPNPIFVLLLLNQIKGQTRLKLNLLFLRISGQLNKLKYTFSLGSAAALQPCKSLKFKPASVQNKRWIFYLGTGSDIKLNFNLTISLRLTHAAAEPWLIFTLIVILSICLFWFSSSEFISTAMLRRFVRMLLTLIINY